MNSTFQMACQLIHDISHLSIHILDPSTHAPSPIPMGSDETALSQFIKDMEPKKFYYLTVQYEIHCILFLLNNMPVSVGPFCCLIWTEEECVQFLRSANIRDTTPMELLACRSQYPVIPKQDALHIAQSFTRLFDPASETWGIADVDNFAPKLPGLPDAARHPLKNNYSELIQERYQTEQRFISDVENGNSHAAILNLRNMQRDVMPLKQIGTTLENERIGAAIVRTMLRLAAFRQGLPAAAIDLLSQNNTVATRQAATVEDIYKEKENMVRTFCQEIKAHQEHRYSNLVLGMIHCIDRQYAQDLSIRQMADERNVNINHLISAFRRETGLTPGAYIRQTRMRHGARLLAETDLSVQDIGSMVGVPDANYFIKLFKKEYSLTPTQYRKFHRL